MNRRTGFRYACAAALIGGWALGGAARADTIRYGGITYKGVEVRGYTNGMLVVTMPGGVERQLPLAVIESMGLDKYPQMSEADGLMTDGRFSEAADLLAGVFEGAEEKHVRMLSGAKWVNCLDLAGRADDCVSAFIAYLGARPGDLADGVAPTNLPAEPAERQQLAAVVADELENSFELRTKKLLGELLERLKAAPKPVVSERDGAETAPSTASPAVRGSVPNGSAARGRQAEETDEVDALLKRGDASGALKRVNEQIAERSGSLSKRLYQRGLCEAKLGRDKDAALSFMRVVVHFNTRTSAWYIPSLIGAGEVLVRVGQVGHARTLLNEAVSLTQEDDGKRAEHEKASRLLEGLKGSD